MYVSLEVFSDAVETLQQGLASGEARLLVRGTAWGPPVKFEFSAGSDLASRFGQADARPVSDELLDITDVLTAIISGADADRFSAFRSDPQRFSEDEEEQEMEPIEQAEQKYQLVTQSFPIEDLRARHWAKVTGSTPVLTTAQWEVVIKRSASSEESPPGLGSSGIPLALLRLEGREPDSAFYPEGVESLTLTLDEDDVSFLIDTLTALTSDLQSVRNTEPRERT